jgi:hypothetical protein
MPYRHLAEAISATSQEPASSRGSLRISRSPRADASSSVNPWWWTCSGDAGVALAASRYRGARTACDALVAILARTVETSSINTRSAATDWSSWNRWVIASSWSRSWAFSARTRRPHGAADAS